MPVFIMGIIAGLQKNREVNDGKFSDHNLSKHFLHNIFPWGFSFNGEQAEDMDGASRKQKWIRRIYGSFCIMTVSIAFFFTDNMTYTFQGWSVDLRPFIRFVAGHFFFVHLQLLLVQGLVNDEGESLLGKILRTRPLQYLGNYYAFKGRVKKMEFTIKVRIPPTIKE